MLNNKSILITGGTGSFGKKFIETILRDYPEVTRIVIYSRDELKQFELKQKYPKYEVVNVTDELQNLGIIYSAQGTYSKGGTYDYPIYTLGLDYKSRGIRETLLAIRKK